MDVLISMSIQKIINQTKQTTMKADYILGMADGIYYTMYDELKHLEEVEDIIFSVKEYYNKFDIIFNVNIGFEEPKIKGDGLTPEYFMPVYYTNTLTFLKTESTKKIWRDLESEFIKICSL